MRTVNSFGLLLVAALASPLSQAQTYPTKPVRIFCGSAGGSSDTVSRLVAGAMSGPLGQAVVVENQAPAALALNAARATPDGYTLLITGGLLWIAPMFSQDDPGYDTLRDFTPITTLTRQATVLAVPLSVPANSVAELIKLAKAQPGALNYSTSSDGTASHISGALFASMAGINVVRVPYKSQSQATTDLLAGRIQIAFDTGPAMAPLIKGNKIRALGTSGLTRSALFPDLPTVAETVPGFEAEQLLGLLAPAKVPAAIITRLNQEAVKGVARPEVREKLLAIGLEPGGGTSEQFTTAIKNEIARVSKAVKSSGAAKNGA